MKLPKPSKCNVLLSIGIFILFLIPVIPISGEIFAGGRIFAPILLVLVMWISFFLNDFTPFYSQPFTVTVLIIALLVLLLLIYLLSNYICQKQRKTVPKSPPQI